MVMTAPKLQVGSKLKLGSDGGLWTVEGWDGGRPVLHSNFGHYSTFTLASLVEQAGYQLLDSPEQSKLPAFGDLVDAYPTEALDEARELEAHLLEYRYGYRSGQPSLALAHEPRPEYDPERKESERAQAKVAELKALGHRVQSLSALRGHWKRYCTDNQGLRGLIDGRELPSSNIKQELAPDVVLMVEELMDSYESKPSPTLKAFREELKSRIEEGGRNPLEVLPSEGSVNRRLKEMGRPRGLFCGHSAKRRQQDALRPETPYHRKRPERAGEFVLLDSTPLDLFCIDEHTGDWVRLELVVAMDLMTRCILALRLLPIGISGLDVSFLLGDIVRPVPMREGWPPEARWSYHGVPENLVMALTREWGIDEAPARVPLVVPDAFVVDGAWAYDSWAFRDGLVRLGSSVCLTRKRRPTDKAHLERFFRTLRQDWIQRLDGYIGEKFDERGVDAEDQAIYTISQLERMLWEWVILVYHERPHSGCHLEEACELALSPNDMYELCLARQGFLHVPPSRDLYLHLLPKKAVEIQHYGVDVNTRVYDGPGLEGLRRKPSRLGGRYGDKWPVAYDPRDLSRVYFQHPDGSWHELEWEHHRPGDQRVGLTLMDVARRIVTRLFGPAASRRERNEQVDEMARRLVRDARADAKETADLRTLRRVAVADAARAADEARIAAAGAKPARSAPPALEAPQPAEEPVDPMAAEEAIAPMEPDDALPVLDRSGTEEDASDMGADWTDEADEDLAEDFEDWEDSEL